MTTSRDINDEPSRNVAGLTLRDYVDVCRALVREGAGSMRALEATLAAHGLTRGRWDVIHRAWTERIRADSVVRAEFQRLYTAPARRDLPDRNE